MMPMEMPDKYYCAAVRTLQDVCDAAYLRPLLAWGRRRRRLAARVCCSRPSRTDSDDRCNCDITYALDDVDDLNACAHA